jgi:heme-degrading monooxygenase HmoA
MAEYVTFRRWQLKEDATEAALVALVRGDIAPAYRTQAGCERLELLRIAAEDSRSYLAITYWQSRAHFDAWAGEGGQTWRDNYRATLERWLQMMTFEEEFAAEQVSSLQLDAAEK